MNSIGERIRELRTARKMTQNEFADRINVTKSTVSAYENGTRLPSHDVLIKIARLFKVSTDNLLGYSEKSVLDVTGLTRTQINTLQDVITTYQRHNLLYQKMMEEDGGREWLTSMELMKEGNVDWMK